LFPIAALRYEDRVVRNIELKARLPDPAAARKAAVALATQSLGTQHQIDTYFDCREGRLKLREIDGISAELIWYDRTDRRGPKASDYVRVPVANPQTLKAALSAALGVRVVVQKRREIFLVDNVRIHLDEVVSLGSFLKFEAVLGPDSSDADGRAQLDRLTEAFSVSTDDLLAGSYADLLGG
jgi:predicted adenylyl cyclase CyaB